MSVEDIRISVLPILKSFGATRAGLFGSAARGDMTPNRDIDLLIEMHTDFSLLDFIDLKQQLEAKLGTSVDLVEYSMLKPALKEKILREQHILL